MSAPMANFNLQAFLDTANELVRADEVSRALWLLDNLPAYYRDYPPIEVRSLKDKILKKVCTPTSYASNNWDLCMEQEIHLVMEHSLRGMLITKDLELCNEKELKPHVIDYGPGEYWLPRLLQHKKLDFSYESIHLHNEAHKKAKEFLKEHMDCEPSMGPKIYVACEIIEHLWYENDIRVEMLKTCGLADIIHISTPLYSFDFNCDDWDRKKDDLGHLRAYTPSEFQRTVKDMFPEYISSFYHSQVMHLRLTRKDSYPFIMETALKNML